MVGLEPTNAGVKVPCLTAWLHPIIDAGKYCANSNEREPKPRPALFPEVKWGG